MQRQESEPRPTKRSIHMSALVRLGILLALLCAASAVPAHAVTPHTCGGFAPTKTICQNGSNDSLVFSSLVSHDVAADINYAGTLESRLIWSGGTRTFRCTYSQALPRQCIATGAFPPVNAKFTHRCRSLVPGSAVNPAPGVAHDGTEGGVGTWSCTVVV